MVLFQLITHITSRKNIKTIDVNMKKLFLLLLLSGLLSFSFSQVKWDYPVKPGSDEWKSFTTHQQMVEACKIPEVILSKMTTSELLEAWENFPLKLDIIAFNSSQQGFEAQKKISEALKLLLVQNDVGEIVLARFKKAKSIEQKILARQEPSISINDYWMLRILISQKEISSTLKKEEDKRFIENEIARTNRLYKSQTSLNIYTPRGTYVPNTVRSDGTNDPWERGAFDVSGTDTYYRNTYPQATLLSSSTRTYNCHSYAWADGYSNRTWINSPSDDLYFQNSPGDGSYDFVSENIATQVSYSGDHSAVTTGTSNVYISKWGAAPLMQHAKDYCPVIYQSASQFHRRSVDVPQDQSSIPSAISAAVQGQTINVSNSQTLQSDITVPGGITLSFVSGASINLNGNSILTTSGNIYVSGGSFSGLSAMRKQSGAIKGIYSSYQTAWSALNNNETLELASGTFNESPSFSSRTNISLTGQGSSSTIINSSITVTNSSNIQISSMRIANGVYSNNSQLVYVSSCDFPGSTLFCDYGSTNTNVSNSTAQIGSASFAVNLYGGTGNVFYNTVKNYDCGVFLSNSASYNIGDHNTFCNNGADIYAQNGAYAYAISNTYSLPVPQSIYGNVFITGVNSVCNLQKASSFQINAANTFDSKLLKDADDKYLTLLRKINDDSKKEKYNKSKYVNDYSNLIEEYKNVIKLEKVKQIFKAALSKLNHLYKAKEDLNSFTDYLIELANSKLGQQYIPYIKRYSIWNAVDNNDYNNSIALADAVIKDAGDDEDLTCEMLYEKGLIYKYYIKNQSKAEEIFGELISNYPKHLLAKYASNESGIEFKEQGSIKTMKSEELVGYCLDNYPNPFNPTTTIRYSLPKAGYVSLKVYDLLGREVADLVNSFKDGGQHSVLFDAGKLASGFYIYTIKVNDFFASKKMLLTK
ncbi:MAG: T9SS type A sorting domain-containing protein [Ignavibacteria bacterium]|nr:T9SS type A sorting domain-containing protein [Ignavibacteria bacterium]